MNKEFLLLSSIMLEEWRWFIIRTLSSYISLVRVISPMCGFVNYDNPCGLMFSLSLYEGIFHSCCLWSMCWIQVWIPWRQRYILYIGIKIINSKRRISYDQDLECWIFKRWIQDMALNRCHGCLMSWDMVDKDLEHATKWRDIYIPQEIKLEN